MNKHLQRGFNLIEVLVALVVLSLGLLGIAGLQLTTIRDTQYSYFRSQASTFMNDLAERIYANTAAAPLAAGGYGGFDSNGVNCANPPARICARETAGGATPAACTPTQMATYDIFASACGMPSGTGRVGGVIDMLPSGRITADCISATDAATACTPAAHLRLRINVFWTEPNSGAQQISMVIQP